jgi:mannan endo-1,4-beta-mannosidase
MLSTCGVGLAAEACTVNGRAWPVCGTDSGGWAFEEGQYCIARSFCPANRTSLPTVSGRAAPVDANATPKTKALYGYLRNISGKLIIAGQQDLTWHDAVDMAERVRNDTGRYPALMGYDFMNYGSRSRDGLQQTEEAIAWSRRGGLVTFAWHWRVPTSPKTADERPGAFYTNQTSFTIPVINGALDTSSVAYARINESIDLIATELRKLSNAGVPVLWRPLHEASGNNGEGWFWWGRVRNDAVPQAYANILLWRHLYDRLVRVHGLHNLIWVWNGQDPAWYPGDDTVDVIGWDIYDTSDDKTYRSQISTYRLAQMMSREQKLIALSENSFIPDPDKIAQDGARWSWFMTWSDGMAGAGVTDSNNFWTGEYYNTNAHKRKVYNHALIITLDELPQF